MCIESEETKKNRVSRLSNMNNSQNLNSLDFVPKSDYNEKWYLENKCPLRNQQVTENWKNLDFLECDKCRTRKSCPGSLLANEYSTHSEDKFQSKIEGSNVNKKSGDWKCDEESIKASTGNIVQEPTTSEWRWKNPYSVSDFDRSRRWYQRNISGDNYSASLLRDLRTIDSRYKDPLKDDTEKNLLCNFREYLVNYQECCGVPRTEYSFSALISTMGRATGRSLLALLYVMLNIIPVVEVFLYLLRFVVDKLISIRNSKDFRQTIIRCFVFTSELFSVYVCLIFIFGFIVLPILHIVIDIVAKIMLFN